MATYKTDNVIVSKSEDFALRVVNLYKHLKFVRKESTMSKQILRSGTSIGANIAESQFAQSKADFITKLKISQKETSETAYWLKLLFRSDFLQDKEYDSMKKDCDEILNILSAIIKKSEYAK